MATTPKPDKIDGAPGLQWRGRADHWVAVWIARDDLVRRGYSLKTSRLWPPTSNVRDPFTDGVKKHLRSECQRLQDEMLAWSRSQERDAPLFDGTIGGLIRCYRVDPEGGYKNLRWASRKNYDSHFGVIEKTVGGSRLSAIKGRHFKRWFDQWSMPKIEGGARRVPRAHAAITMLRIIFGHGVALLDDDNGSAQCLRLQTILASMQFENGKSRVEEITREQATAIRTYARSHGRQSVALAQALMFELTVRQKDAIGEWLPLDEPGLSDITWRGQKWLYGFDWREVTDMKLRHRLSKSLKGKNAILDPHTGKTKVWNLALYPMVMEEFELIPDAARVGPMVLNERTGRPWVYESFQQCWRDIATAVGVPKHVQNRDTRAGAITETIGVSDLESARISAGHSNVTTTQIYSRGDERRTADIAVLRARKAMKTDGERP